MTASSGVTAEVQFRPRRWGFQATWGILDT
jgi:hypothetical protein